MSQVDDLHTAVVRQANSYRELIWVGFHITIVLAPITCMHASKLA